jgi:hypothetical protein
LESKVILRMLSIVLGLAGVGWLALLFSSRAVLVREQVEPSTLHRKLVCTYFAATRTIRKEYWYAKSDTFGRAACPRWEQVRPAAE